MKPKKEKIYTAHEMHEIAEETETELALKNKRET